MKSTSNNNQESLSIAGPSGKLEALLEQPTQTTPTTHNTLAIICHPHPLHGGTMNNKVVTTLVRTCQQLGAVAIRFNFRGVGESEGLFDQGIGEQADLQAVIAWAQARYPGYRLWLAGFSFGSYIAANVASRQAVDLLITIAPPVHHFDFEHLAKISCPWLVAQGEADEVVPSEQVFAWLATRPEPIHLIRMPNVGHFFHGQLIELREALIAELTSLKF